MKNPLLSLLSKVISICFLTSSLLWQSCDSDDDDSSTVAGTPFKVVGRDLVDPCGDKVLLKGVNKMSVFDDGDIYGVNYFPEIAKTNANCVRIVWLASYSSTQQLARLDSLIKNCIKNKMIPMLELHDATCNWTKLGDVVAFWIKPAVVELIKKYQHALLVNIANEAGNQGEVTETQYLAGYKDAITKMRTAGIKTPLFIDGPDCGKNLDVIVATSAALIQHDPDHNIMFSVHTYWSNLDIATHATPTFIKDQLQTAVNGNVPLIMGELCAFGGWPGVTNDKTLICTSLGSVDYQTMMAEAATRNIGWLLWEWGPGNGFFNEDTDGDGDIDPTVLCPAMDITTDATYNSIVAIGAASPNAWAKDAVITNGHSLKNTSVKSAYITNGFKCM